MTRLGPMPRLRYTIRCARPDCNRIVATGQPVWTMRAECEGECGVVTASIG